MAKQIISYCVSIGLLAEEDAFIPPRLSVYPASALNLVDNNQDVLPFNHVFNLESTFRGGAEGQMSRKEFRMAKCYPILGWLSSREFCFDFSLFFASLSRDTFGETLCCENFSITLCL